MAVKRGGLGKGLDSLIPDMNVGSASSPKTEVKTKIVEKVVEKVVEVVPAWSWWSLAIAGVCIAGCTLYIIGNMKKV